MPLSVEQEQGASGLQLHTGLRFSEGVVVRESQRGDNKVNVYVSDSASTVTFFYLFIVHSSPPPACIKVNSTLHVNMPHMRIRCIAQKNI